MNVSPEGEPGGPGRQKQLLQQRCLHSLPSTHHISEQAPIDGSTVCIELVAV